MACHDREVMRVALCMLLAACWSAAPAPTHSPPEPVAQTGSANAENATSAANANANTATPPAPLPFVSTCVTPNDPAIAEVQRKAADATKQAFESELVRQRLRTIALGMHHKELAQGLTYAGGARTGTTVRNGLGEFVAAETAWSGNPTAPPAWEFVQNDRGEVFRLVRRPAAAITKVILCACRPQQCGPYGSGCPACGSTSQTSYGPLPAGAMYKGDLVVAHPANVVSIDYDPKQACPAPRACPGPPP